MSIAALNICFVHKRISVTICPSYISIKNSLDSRITTHGNDTLCIILIKRIVFPSRNALKGLHV